MNKPHKHAEVIKQWADGSEVELQQYTGEWTRCLAPLWYKFNNYRIKPPTPAAECWMIKYSDGQLGSISFETKEELLSWLIEYPSMTEKVVHLREVIGE